MFYSMARSLNPQAWFSPETQNVIGMTSIEQILDGHGHFHRIYKAQDAAAVGFRRKELGCIKMGSGWARTVFIVLHMSNIRSLLHRFIQGSKLVSVTKIPLFSYPFLQRRNVDTTVASTQSHTRETLYQRCISHHFVHNGCNGRALRP